MRKLRRGLASLLAALMLITALPATALADSGLATDSEPITNGELVTGGETTTGSETMIDSEPADDGEQGGGSQTDNTDHGEQIPDEVLTDVVIYNLLDREITVGYDEGRVETDPSYVTFDADDSYTIVLTEEDPFFPYEVQFTYQGRTWTEWFMDMDDSVDIGGHTFYIDSDSAPCQIGVWVGDEYIPTYPEEKTFTNYGISLMSMLPLEERNVTLDLKSYLPGELKAVALDVFSGDVTENIAAWAKWSYYTEDGNYVSSNDSYTVVGEGDTFDLSNYSGSNNSLYLELIVGTADQFDPNNVRYRVRVEISSYQDVLEFSAKTEAGTAIDVYDHYISLDSDSENTCDVAVDQKDWQYGDEAYLNISIDDNFSGASTTAYLGYYESEEAIPDDAIDITNDILENDYLADYSSGMAVTLVVKRNDTTGLFLPMVIYMYEDGLSLDYGRSLYAASEGTSRIDVWNGATRDRDYDYDYRAFTLDEGYPADGTYYFNLRMYNPADTSSLSENGKEYVKKAVIGYYETISDIPAGAPDIKDQLFSDASENGGGYGADYSQGVTFTVVDVNDGLHWFGLRTVAYEEDTELPRAPSPLSADTYFRAISAYSAAGDEDSGYDVWVMPYDADTYYYNGFQTVFLMTEEGGSVSDGTNIYPTFYSGNKVNVHAGTDNNSSTTKQESGVTPVTFTSGKAIPYSAAAEDGEHLKNYWVTYVTPQSGGAKLFVNGTNVANHYDEETGNPVREVFLTEEFDYYHDIFIANIGDQELTGLKVELTDAQNIALDDYWTIGEDSVAKLAAFKTTESREPDDSLATYGELPNVAKIRLVPVEDGAGDISGTLTIRSENGGIVTIKLTGTARIPKITTTELVDGVKYVPYSSVIQTSNMYGDDSVEFTVVAGTLPSGVILKPNGELYGVPQAAGTWTFTVRATFTDLGNAYDEREFTLTIQDNTNSNVWDATDEGYELIEFIGEWINDNQVSDEYDYDTILKDNYETDVFWTEGEFNYFIDLWIDGRQLTRGVDYEAEDGSTRITIYDETFEDTGSGTHTIAAEFREGDPETGTLKRAAQNYTIDESVPVPSDPRPSRPSGGNTSNTGSSADDTDDNAAADDDSAVPETPAAEPGWPFVDVTSANWFYEDVRWAYEAGLMNGVSDTLFAPNQAISQATIVTVLARMADVDLTRFIPAEDDDSIAAGTWYANAAVWAGQAGLLPDYSTFSGEAAIARGDMAIMLVKYLRSLGIDTSVPVEPVVFADADQMTPDVNAAFQVLYHYGIFRGVGGYRMDPSGFTTRAQFSALIHRISVFVQEQQ